MDDILRDPAQRERLSAVLADRVGSCHWVAEGFRTMDGSGLFLFGSLIVAMAQGPDAVDAWIKSGGEEVDLFLYPWRTEAPPEGEQLIGWVYWSEFPGQPTAEIVVVEDGVAKESIGGVPLSSYGGVLLAWQRRPTPLADRSDTDEFLAGLQVKYDLSDEAIQQFKVPWALEALARLIDPNDLEVE